MSGAARSICKQKKIRRRAQGFLQGDRARSAKRAGLYRPGRGADRAGQSQGGAGRSRSGHRARSQARRSLLPPRRRFTSDSPIPIAPKPIWPRPWNSRPTTPKPTSCAAKWPRPRARPTPPSPTISKAVELDPFIEGVPEKLKKLTGVEEQISKPLGEAVKGWEIISPSKRPLRRDQPALSAAQGAAGNAWRGPAGDPRLDAAFRCAARLRPAALRGRQAAGRRAKAAATNWSPSSICAGISWFRSSRMWRARSRPNGNGRRPASWSPMPKGVISAHELREPPKPKPEPRPVRDRPGTRMMAVADAATGASAGCSTGCSDSAQVQLVA